MKRITQDEFKRKYGENALDGFTNPVAPPEAGVVSRLADVGSRTADRFKGAIQGTGEFEGQSAIRRGITATATGFSTIPVAALALAPDVIREPIEKVGETIGGAFSKLTEYIGSNKTLQQFTQDYPAFSNTIVEVAGSLSGAGEIAGTITGVKGVLKTAGAVKTGAVATAKTLTKVGEGVIDTTKTVAGKVAGVIRPTIESVKNIPSRIGTNIEALKVSEQAIKALPSVAQKTVRQGIDVEDVSGVLKMNAAQKVSNSKLYKITKDFVEGKTEINPIEAVGKPVVDRLNTLKSQTSKFGNQLDDIAEGLVGKPVKGRDSIIASVDEKLAKLRITKLDDGLNFKGSNIEGLGANEKIINNVYRRIQESTDANDLHRLKKYIDNNVSFGKTGDGFIGEAESLLKNWRKVIDDTLDVEFKDYNKVNIELASRLKPINDFKRIMKDITGLDEDLVNMSAGMLMRRIASNLRSNPQLRQVLRDLDKATEVKGKLSADIESLVDFYSVLEKYYPEIVGKNTLKGQMIGAIEASGSLADKALSVAKTVAGQSEAVKRKAITNFLDDFFSK